MSMNLTDIAMAAAIAKGKGGWVVDDSLVHVMFNDFGQHAQDTYSSSRIMTIPFTMEVCTNDYAASGYGRIIEYEDGSSSNRINSIQLEATSSTINIYVCIRGTWYQNIAQMSKNENHTISVVVNNGSFDLYVDGEFILNRAHSAAVTGNNTMVRFYNRYGSTSGRQIDNATNYRAALYTRALTAAEIKQNFAADVKRQKEAMA